MVIVSTPIRTTASMEAWAVVATSARNSVARTGDDGVAAIATDVAFTEGLLRNILRRSVLTQVRTVSISVSRDAVMCGYVLMSPT